MRAHFRARGASISAFAPPTSSVDYSPSMAKIANSILYRSPLPSRSGHPIYILNSAALPDTHEVDYDTLLPYVLARLPGDEELVSGYKYELIFFAGGASEGATSTKKTPPGVGWILQAYHVLSRAMRKRIQKLYIVHQSRWVRVLVEMFSTIASPKFRKKIVHASTLSALALHLPVENILIPPSAYLRNRQLEASIVSPYACGKRAFGASHVFPRNTQGQSRLPRVLRETTTFILLHSNVNTEGLFRIPAHAKLREILRDGYDRGQKFIVWKEHKVALPLPKYDYAEDIDAIVAAVDQSEAYGVHLAAGLLKSWYADLKDPLFPPSCYRELKMMFGNPTEPPSLGSMVDLLSSTSEWSVLPLTSRKILTRHLLPLLSLIARHSDKNKMTAENLAVCFAPTLLRGPDQLEDMKVSTIIRRILAKAVELWPNSLREALHIQPSAFARDLQAPARIEDYEDPVDLSAVSDFPKSPGFQEHQVSGIVMRDNDGPANRSISRTNSRPKRRSIARTESSVVVQSPPPLPPRMSWSGELTYTPPLKVSSLRRKPAPPLVMPPRYSTISAGPPDMLESPSTYTTMADGFASPSRGDWSYDSIDGSNLRPARHDSHIKRKAVPIRTYSYPMVDVYGKEKDRMA